MPLLSRFSSLSRAQKLVWLAAGVFAALLMVGLFIGLRSGSKPSATTNQHYDAFSHQTVSSPAGKAPDTYGAAPHTPLYLGFDKLLDHGVTFNQLVGLKEAFYNYSASQKFYVKQVSVDVDHINVYKGATSGLFYTQFRVMINSKTIYTAKADDIDLNSTVLHLIDSTGKEVYNSATAPADGQHP